MAGPHSLLGRSTDAAVTGELIGLRKASYLLTWKARFPTVSQTESTPTPPPNQFHTGKVISRFHALSDFTQMEGPGPSAQQAQNSEQVTLLELGALVP